jgi:hypothetical protein
MSAAFMHSHQPILIPVRTKDSVSELPEWAMIEVNGEFSPPKDEADVPSDTLLSLHHEDDDDVMELGALHFVDGKVRVTVEESTMIGYRILEPNKRNYSY